jgi:CO/xanthine dehydrogenase FAD-binding subunit
MVIGGEGTDAAVADAVQEAIGNLEVFGDHHYPEDYRRHVLQAILQRALMDAIAKTGTRHVQ